MLRAGHRGGRCALVLGYFMIYGRISGVFFGIVTLSVTLALRDLPGPDRRARNGGSAARG